MVVLAGGFDGGGVPLHPEVVWIALPIILVDADGLESGVVGILPDHIKESSDAIVLGLRSSQITMS